MISQFNSKTHRAHIMTLTILKLIAKPKSAQKNINIAMYSLLPDNRVLILTIFSLFTNLNFLKQEMVVFDS